MVNDSREEKNKGESMQRAKRAGIAKGPLAWKLKQTPKKKKC